MNNIFKKIFIATFFFCSVGGVVGASNFDTTNTVLEWSETARIGGKIRIDSLSAVNNSSEVVVVAENLSGEVVYVQRVENFWSEWKNLNGKMKGQAALDADGNSVYVAIRGLDDALWFNQKNSSGWMGWSSWGGGMTASPVILKTDIGVEAAIKGLDDSLWVKRKNNDGTFADWRKIGDLKIKGDISIAGDGGEVIIVARGQDNKIYVVERNGVGIWGEWNFTGGVGVSDPIIYNEGGIYYMAAVGRGNGLWYVKKENGVWGDWQSLGGNLTALRPVIAGDSGNIAFFAMAPTNEVWYRLLRGGQWVDWHAANGRSNYFDAASVGGEILLLQAAADNLVYRSSFYPTPALTASDFNYQDYGIEDTASGGKTLSFYLANGNHKVRISYNVEPGRKTISKKIDLVSAEASVSRTGHGNTSRAGVYINANGNQFAIGNDYIERKFTVSNGVVATTQIYNKISGKSHFVVSDEFGIGFRNASEPVFIDIERMSIGENCAWSGGIGEPLIYSDLFSWSDNPFSVPKLVNHAGGQYLVWRLYYHDKIKDQYSDGGSKAVLGVARNNRGMEDFRQFVVDSKKTENKFFFTYNSWWTAPFRYTENDLLGLIDKLDQNLISPYGAKIDSFTIDEGWANPQSIWKINSATFPNGLGNLVSKLNAKGMALGLWISPGAVYQTLDKNWAEKNGYNVFWSDTGQKIMCFAPKTGSRSYTNEFKNTLAGYLTNYNIANVKFDFWNYCRDYDAGEAENFFGVWDYLKTVKPSTRYELNIIFNPTAFPRGDVIKESGSDDYPSGMLPALNYKNAYLTTRDQHWLGTVKKGVPPRFITTYGIIIQTDDDWRDDAIANLLRGVSYVPLYIDPAKMTTKDWADLAGMMKWARANQETLLGNTSIIGGEPKDGVVYGISHFNAKTREAYIYLRNPVIDEKDFTLALDSTTGFTVNDQYAVKAIYPYRYVYDGIYGMNQSINVHLKGFETLVLHIKPQAAVVNELIGIRYLAANGNNDALRIFGQSGTNDNIKNISSGIAKSMKANFCSGSSTFRISSSGLSKGSNSIAGNFNIDSGANYTSQLVVAVSSTNYFNTASINNFSFTIDGAAAPPFVKNSDVVNDKNVRKNNEQWHAESPGDLTRHYWKYFIVDIPVGNRSVTFRVNGIPSGASASANILATEILMGEDVAGVILPGGSDDQLPERDIDKLTSTIPVGQNIDWSRSCQGIATCSPGAISGCKVCKIDGSGWQDDNSKCVSGKKCSAGECVSCNCSAGQICIGGQCASCQWSELKNLGGILKYAPSVAGLSDRLVITGIGDDNAVWANEYLISTNNSGWYGLGGILNSRTKMTMENSRPAVYALGTDNNVWKRQYQSPKTWSQWVSAGSADLGNYESDVTMIGNIHYKVTLNGDKSTSIHKCVSDAVCAAKTCATLGNYQCGSWSDGCGKTLNCGTCTSGKTCNAGQCVSNCSSRAAKKCDGADLYWYNSCNAKEGLAQNCSAENKICRDGVCVSSGGGGGGGIIEPQKEQPQKMTRAEILQKIAQIKQLLVQLIVQLIAELQKQLAATQ